MDPFPLAPPAPARRVIRQPVPGRALQELFWKRLKLPRRIVQPAIRAAVVACSPAQVRLRRRLASEIAGRLAVERSIAPEAGYRFFEPEEVPGTAEAVTRCAELAADRVPFALNARKPFLLSLLAGADFLEHPELIRYMVSRPLLDVVTTYLGSVPLLAGASLLYSPSNQSTRSSQLYHVDDEETTQVKVFLNVNPVDEDQGPFTLLPADISREVARSLHYDHGRLPDRAVEEAGGSGHALQLVGRAGRGLFVDTSRCLHFGSRANRRDRLMLLIQFLRFDAPTHSKARLQVPPDLEGLEPDPIQRLALGLA